MQLHHSGLLLAAAAAPIFAQSTSREEQLQQLQDAHEHRLETGPNGRLAYQGMRHDVRQAFEGWRSRSLPSQRERDEHPGIDSLGSLGDSLTNTMSRGHDLAFTALKHDADQQTVGQHQEDIKAVNHGHGMRADSEESVRPLSAQRKREMSEFNRSPAMPFGPTEKEHARERLQLAHQDSLRELEQRHHSEREPSMPDVLREHLQKHGWLAPTIESTKTRQSRERDQKSAEHQHELGRFDNEGEEALSTRRRNQMHAGPRNPRDFGYASDDAQPGSSGY